jgi:hypothetical protein
MGRGNSIVQAWRLGVLAFDWFSGFSKPMARENLLLYHVGLSSITGKVFNAASNCSLIIEQIW